MKKKFQPQDTGDPFKNSNRPMEPEREESVECSSYPQKIYDYPQAGTLDHHPRNVSPRIPQMSRTYITTELISYAPTPIKRRSAFRSHTARYQNPTSGIGTPRAPTAEAAGPIDPHYSGIESHNTVVLETRISVNRGDRIDRESGEIDFQTKKKIECSSEPGCEKKGFWEIVGEGGAGILQLYERLVQKEGEG